MLTISSADKELSNGTAIINISFALYLPHKFRRDCLSHHHGFLPVMVVEEAVSHKVEPVISNHTPRMYLGARESRGPYNSLRGNGYGKFIHSHQI